MKQEDSSGLSDVPPELLNQENADGGLTKKKKPKRKRRTRVQIKEELDVATNQINTGTGDQILQVNGSIEVKAEVKEEEDEGPAPKRHKRKTKEEKEAEMIPLAARTPGMRIQIGAHVSIAKGVQNAVKNAVHIGSNSFAMFLKSQRKWQSPEMKDEDAAVFRELCEREGYDPRRNVLPHGSYLVNLANADIEKAKQAYDCFIDDLRRCEALNIGLYNFHPGSTLGQEKKVAWLNIANAINRCHRETSFVKTILENMSGQGRIIGSTFEDLAGIIALVKDKSRVGVCLDTCHSFAAGYDLRTEECFNATLETFDQVVGMKYLSGMHLNDSKAPLGAKRDLHQNIGLGFLGLEPFRLIVNDKRMQGLPHILETPQKDPKIWADEVKLLEWCIGKRSNDPEFLKSASVLSEKGQAEREKVLEALEKKAAKDRKKKARNRDETTTEEESSDDDDLTELLN